MPAGTLLIISPFLFLVEVVSYFSRVISLSVRLFDNMLSGHAVLKILMSFSGKIVQTVEKSTVLLVISI